MIRILLVDDHVLFRQGLKAVLAEQAHLRLAAEAGDYWEAMEALRHGEFDIAIVDLSMPGRDGLDLIDALKATVPKLPILVLTAHAEEEYAARALRAGASGFLTKDVNAGDMVQAIGRVASGRTSISPRVAENVAMQLSRQRDSPQPHSKLSSREFKVFEMLAQGRRVSTIAVDMNLSIKTVSTYKMRVLKKMCLDNQSELVRYAMRNHLGFL